MQVTLRRIDNDFHFEALGTAGVPVQIDGSPDIGGHNAGARPMEMLLMGLGGCSAIDIILILKKQRQIVEDFRIEVSGSRVKDATPSPFETIHLHYMLKGSLDETKVRRAIELSMQKYCSVTVMLEKSATISWDIAINPS